MGAFRLKNKPPFVSRFFGDCMKKAIDTDYDFLS